MLYVENNCVMGSEALIKLIDGAGYLVYWDLQPYFNENNYFNHEESIFPANMLSINMDLHFPALACSELSIDVRDSTGTEALTFRNSVSKLRTTSAGAPIGMPELLDFTERVALGMRLHRFMHAPLPRPEAALARLPTACAASGLQCPRGAARFLR